MGRLLRRSHGAWNSDQGTVIRQFDPRTLEAGSLATRLGLDKAYAPSCGRATIRLPRGGASLVAAAQDEDLRAAGLAVLDAAEHRMARDAMSCGGPQRGASSSAAVTLPAPPRGSIRRVVTA